MSVREYEICEFGLNGQRGFFIWYSDEDEKDGVVVDDNYRLLIFESKPNAARFAGLPEIPLSDDPPTFFDLEKVSLWCESPGADGIDRCEFLNAWNLFDDLTSSCNQPASLFAYSSKTENGLYDKLFWGNNLPSVTPIGEHYEPEWSQEEIKGLQEVLWLGLCEFQDRLIREAA